MVKDSIVKWTNLTNEITEQWIRDYFGVDEEEEVDFDWVSVGGVFSFADYWFDFQTVLDCYELKIKQEQLFQWYDFCLDNHSVNISLAKYILSPQERKEQEEKHLAELRERVKSAEKELEKALEQYENNRT